jgi:hypothetical protein
VCHSGAVSGAHVAWITEVRIWLTVLACFRFDSLLFHSSYFFSSVLFLSNVFCYALILLTTTTNHNNKHQTHKQPH